MRSHLPLVLAAFALTAPYSAKAAPASHGTHHVDAALEAALKAPTRTPANVARDRYRHPAETLGSFGIRPDMTVVEIWPGGGWYTEILALYQIGRAHIRTPVTIARLDCRLLLDQT